MLPFYGDTVQLCEKNDHVMTTLQDVLLFRSAVYWYVKAGKFCWRNLTYITSVQDYKKWESASSYPLLGIIKNTDTYCKGVWEDHTTWTTF